MTRALTYHGHTAYVDDEDFEAVRHQNWRALMLSGRTYFVYSLPRPGKQNVYLTRLIADRMGLPPGRLRYADGNALNATRANISWYGNLRQSGITRNQPRHTPPGFHRHKAGSARPASTYQLCAGPMTTYQTLDGKRWDSVCTGRDPVGTARRTAGGQWKAQLAGGPWSPPFRRFCDAASWALGDSQEAA